MSNYAKGLTTCLQDTNTQSDGKLIAKSSPSNRKYFGKKTEENTGHKL